MSEHAKALTVDDVMKALSTIIDPELGYDLVFLGLIYDVEIAGTEVYVEMTFTSPFCPVGPEIVAEVQGKVKSLSGVETVDVNVVFDPPWQPPEELEGLLGFL